MDVFLQEKRMENESFPFCGLFPERNKINGNQVSCLFFRTMLYFPIFLCVVIVHHFILFHLSAHNLECQRQNPTCLIAFKQKKTQSPVIADQLPVLLIIDIRS